MKLLWYLWPHKLESILQPTWFQGWPLHMNFIFYRHYFLIRKLKTKINLFTKPCENKKTSFRPGCVDTSLTRTNFQWPCFLIIFFYTLSFVAIFHWQVRRLSRKISTDSLIFSMHWGPPVLTLLKLKVDSNLYVFSQTVIYVFLTLPQNTHFPHLFKI